MGDSNAGWRTLQFSGTSPRLSRRHPDIPDMAPQFDLAVPFRSEPPRHGLRRSVFAVDTMDHPLDLERGEGPVDRGARRLDGIPLALGFPRQCPADLKIRPARRKPRPDPADEFVRFSFPRPRTCRRRAATSARPSRHLCRQPVMASDHRIAVDGDEARGRRDQASIALYGAISAPRHCRSLRRAVSTTGPFGCASVTPDLRGAIIAASI